MSRITNNPSFIITNFIWLSLYCKRLHIFKVTNFFFFFDNTFDYDETFRTGTNSFDGIRCDIVFHWSLLYIVFSRLRNNPIFGWKKIYLLSFRLLRSVVANVVSCWTTIARKPTPHEPVNRNVERWCRGAKNNRWTKWKKYSISPLIILSFINNIDWNIYTSNTW